MQWDRLWAFVVVVGHGVSPLPTELSEDAVPSSAAGGEALDGATGTTVGPKTPPEETYAPSKIPIKRRPSRTFPRSEQFVNRVGPAENSLANRKLLASSKPLTAEGEGSQAVKHGVNYTISSMSNKEEDIGLNREHFKNLKNFWEKGADSVMVRNVPEDPSWVEAEGRQFKLCRSLSVQSGQGQNTEEKPGVFTKTRTPYKRTITLSSSEEEPSYVAPARKGSVSTLPRSTYAKSKGGPVTRNSSLGESNGKPTVPEEEKAAQRCSKKSRLPVRAPSVKIESPTKEVSGSTFEPGTPTDEFIGAEERKHAANSLASGVQILIEPVLTDGENDDEKEERSDLGTHGNVEINGELPGEEMCEPSDQPTPGEPAGEREAVQGTDSAVYSGTEGCNCTLWNPNRESSLSLFSSLAVLHLHTSFICPFILYCNLCRVSMRGLCLANSSGNKSCVAWSECKRRQCHVPLPSSPQPPYLLAVPASASARDSPLVSLALPTTGRRNLLYFTHWEDCTFFKCGAELFLVVEISLTQIE